MLQRTDDDRRKPGTTVPAETPFPHGCRDGGRLTSRSLRRTTPSPRTLSGVTVSLPRILRFSLLAGLLVLLLASCGGQAGVAGTASSSPSTGFTVTPSIESTGQESSQSPSNGGGGGVSISLPGLPIGNAGPEAENNNGSAECVSVPWAGKMPAGVTLTVTSVMIAQGPFTVIDVTTAGCSAAIEVRPGCVGFQLNAADNGGGQPCFAGVEWAGSGPPQDTGDGYLRLGGELSCANADLAACQKIGKAIMNSAPAPLGTSVSFDFCAPSQCVDSPTNTSPTQQTGPSSASTGPTEQTGPSSASTGPTPPTSPGSAATSPAPPSTSSP